MNWRAFIPPAAVAAAKAIRRSFSSDFISGRGYDDEFLGHRTAEFILPREQSGWVRSAIDKKAHEIAVTTLKFYSGDVEYDEPRFAAWWSGTPFEISTGRRLNLAQARIWAATWADLKGEFFIILRDGWNSVSFGARNPASLPPLLLPRPDRMRHIVSQGQIVGWVHTNAGGQQDAYLPEEVIHVPFMSTGEEFRGSAPVDAIFNAAAGDYLAGVYVKNLMRNNGDQGVFVTADGNLDEAQKQQIIASLREKQRRARRGEFAIGFIGGPAKFEIEDAKAQAPGADLTAARLASRHEIYIGLGVPASMADVKAAYSTGASSDRYQLITGSCMALSQFIDRAFERPAAILAGRQLTAEADWDDHPVMIEVRRERVGSALELWGAGMPMKSANDYFDLGLKPYAGWDQGYLPFSVTPVEGASADPVKDPAFAEPVEQPSDAKPDPDVERIRTLLLARQRLARPAPVCVSIESQPAVNDPFAAFTCACSVGEGIVMRDRDPKEVARWRDLMAKRRETMRGYESRFGRELMKARTQVLAKIGRGYKPVDKSAAPTVQRAAAADFLFDLAAWRDGFFATMRKQAAVSLDVAGTQLFEELGRDDPFKFPSEAALNFLRDRENKLSGVPDEVHGRIKEALEEGITAGDSTEELSQRVRAAFNAIDQGRSRVIATTETSAVYGAARQTGMKQAGIAYKKWLTSGGPTVRAAHAAANGQVVPLDNFFEVGGEQLDHPGDPEGSPENIINCHCVQVAAAKPSDS